MLPPRGPAVVFDSIEDLRARLDDPALDVTEDSVLVLRGSPWPTWKVKSGPRRPPCNPGAPVNRQTSVAPRDAAGPDRAGSAGATTCPAGPPGRGRQWDSRETSSPLEPTRKSRSAPRVGLHDVVDVQPLPAAGAVPARAAVDGRGRLAPRELRRRRRRRRAAGRRRRGRSGRRSRTRPSGPPAAASGGDVQDDRAVRGAAHPAVADPHHVAHALRAAAWPAAACCATSGMPG